MPKLYKLKSFRIYHDLTQLDMSERLGLSLSQYERRENGKIKPSRADIKLFASEFDMTEKQAEEIFS